MGKNNRKLTIKEVKNLLKLINKDIVVLDNAYESNKIPMNCECLICGNKFPKSWNCLSKGQGCPACGKNGIKITKQEICEHVSSFGYEVIKFTKDDSNKGTMFVIKCPENHEYETSYREFNREEIKRHGSCKQCNQKRIGSARRKDISDVMKNISNWGYTVEKEFIYKNCLEIHTFKCPNGHERKINYHSLERTPYCPECEGSPLKYTEDDIRKILNEFGLKYLGGYIGSADKFYYECNCGNVAEGTLKSIRKGIRCSKCNKHKRYVIEDIKELFAFENYILMEDQYIDSKYPMKYICDKGHETQVNLNSFLKGTRCAKCYFESVKGENSPHWNPNLSDEDRFKDRKYPEYDKWRLEVYKRDYYTCQCCGDKSGHNLNAHHLDGHDWAIDKRTDVDNGITLCEDCHKDFHNIYGYGNNTREQFEEYMNDLYDNAI
jgi:hypothetical protein